MSRAKAKATAPGNSSAETEVRIGDFVVHPYRVAVPEMPADLLEVLTEEVRDAGRPTGDVTVDAQNRVLDGRAQLRACLAVGVQPHVVISADVDQPAWVVVRSMRRTPYTGAQCAVIAARLAEPLSKEARDRQRNAGRPLPKNFGKGEAAEIAAKAVGKTNAPYVRMAAELLRTQREIVELIDAGLIPRIAQAKALAAMPEPQRKSALRAIWAGKDISLVIDRRKKVDDEWHTPEEIVAAVRDAFDGEIICDPCAPKRGSNVNATIEHTKDDNGLEKPWYDRTFVNPPFSKAKAWVSHAISEATLSPDSDETQAKRIYVLLPIRPDSEHQTNLLESAIDALFLADRVSFDKPGEHGKGTGRISIMIAGLNCSTHELVRHGLDGMVVRRQAPPSSLFEYEDELRAHDELRAEETTRK